MFCCFPNYFAIASLIKWCLPHFTECWLAGHTCSDGHISSWAWICTACISEYWKNDKKWNYMDLQFMSLYGLYLGNPSTDSFFFLHMERTYIGTVQRRVICDFYRTLKKLEIFENMWNFLYRLTIFWKKMEYGKNIHWSCATGVIFRILKIKKLLKLKACYI